uniref:Myb/SANT-like domain-containing protein n=1 Tax=Fagus sylvatica TaxID=28930 RepID=A0A2N9GUQ9_FAGSY
MQSGSKHQWTTTEDEKLVECLVDMANSGPTWKAENGFKSGYLLELERMMLEKISWLVIPNVAGLRNKSFPHYDDLAHVFGKDRAIGFSAEGPSDMAQTVNREEAEKNEDLDDTDDSLASTQGPPIATSLASTQGPPVARSSDNPSGTSTSTSTKRKKGKKSDPVFMQLMDNLSNMGKVYEGATKSMKKLAETFKHEADGAYRRMKVHEELIFAGGGLTDEEIAEGPSDKGGSKRMKRMILITCKHTRSTNRLQQGPPVNHR